ncbi:DDE-type integrase/transposase/recombinase [Neptunomonas qingdaonensis]|nr:DDE-type integrase/transposase/recombinase [Neptunomonas qingdaonensis]
MAVVYDDGPGTVVTRHALHNALANNQLHAVEDEPPAFFSETLLDEQKQWELTRKVAYVADAQKLPNHRSKRVIEGSMRKTAQRIGDLKPPKSWNTVYKWIKKAETIGKDANPKIGLAAQQRKNDSRISEEVENLMRDVIDDVWMQLDQKSRMHAYKIFRHYYFEHFNEDIGMRMKSTFYNRIKRLCPIDVVGSREGPRSAKALMRAALDEILAHNILDLVQLDALHLQVGLLDDDGNFLGYPVVHFAIDVYSRAILGFSIEIGSESAAGVVECLKNAFRVKIHSSDHPYTVNVWIMFGKPFMVGNDGGAAYMAQTVGGLLAAMRIQRQANETRTPWLNGVIERFNGTCRTQFADHLPGYIGKRSNPKGHDITLEKAATLTLSEFEEQLTRYIVDDYNQAPHSHHFGRSPHNVWAEAAEMMPPVEPAGLEFAMRFRGNWIEPTYDLTNGLRIKNIWYNDECLKQIYSDKKRDQKSGPIKMHCLYNPGDISQITVMHGDELFVVTCGRTKNIPVFEGMSLAEYDAKRKRAIRLAEDENNATNSHVDFGVWQHTQSNAEASPVKPKPSGVTRRQPQAPVTENTKTVQAVQIAQHQQLPTEPEQDIEADEDDQISTNPYALAIQQSKNGEPNDE